MNEKKVEKSTDQMTILTLDLGMKMGWALADENWVISSGVENFSGNRFEGGGMRFLRFKRFLKEIINEKNSKISAIYFEEVRAHKGIDASHIYGGFMAHLTALCEYHDIPYAGVPVGTIKKFITGKGNASKIDVIEAVQKKGFSPIDDNEADAIALLLTVRNKKK